MLAFGKAEALAVPAGLITDEVLVPWFGQEEKFQVWLAPAFPGLPWIVANAL